MVAVFVHRLFARMDSVVGLRVVLGGGGMEVVVYSFALFFGGGRGLVVGRLEMVD